MLKQFGWYLSRQRVLLKEYKQDAEETPAALKEHLIEIGQAAGCQMQYLPMAECHRAKVRNGAAVE